MMSLKAKFQVTSVHILHSTVPVLVIKITSASLKNHLPSNNSTIKQIYRLQQPNQHKKIADNYATVCKIKL